MQPPSHHDSGHNGAGSAGPLPSSSSSSNTLSNHQNSGSNLRVSTTGNRSHVLNTHEESNNDPTTPHTTHSGPPTPNHRQRQQQQQSLHGARASTSSSAQSQGQNRNAPNGHHGHSQSIGSEKGARAVGISSTGMGDGILNQSMKEDLESRSPPPPSTAVGTLPSLYMTLSYLLN